MNRYLILKKVLLLIPTVFLISLLSFLMLIHSPGDTAKVILMEKYHFHEVSKEDVNEFKKAKGLNHSALSLYKNWMIRLLKGDLGKSLLTDKPVIDIMKVSLSKTALLAVISFLIQILLCFPLGFFSAYRQGGIIDKLSGFWSILSIATPSYWIALLALYICTAKLKLHFILGYHGFKSFIVPAIIIGFLNAGRLIQIIKSKTLLVLKETYIEQAIASGTPVLRIFTGHVLKNTLAPIIVTLTYSITGLLSGSVLIERIFSIPGLGSLLLNSINGKDFIVASSIIFYLASIICILNLISDIICLKIDRRNESEIYNK